MLQQLSRWQAIEILGTITECAIFGLALHLVYIGRVTVSARAKILLLFSTRALYVIPLTCTPLANLRQRHRLLHPPPHVALCLLPLKQPHLCQRSCNHLCPRRVEFQRHHRDNPAAEVVCRPIHMDKREDL